MNLTQFVNIIFTDRASYQNLTDKEKESFFFIINQQLARKLPEHSESFNHRNTNKIVAMDTWVLFIDSLQNSGNRDWPKNRVPYWFWAKKAANKEEVQQPLSIDDTILKMIRENTKPEASE